MAYLYGSGTLIYGASGGLRISTQAAWTPAALSPLLWYRADSVTTSGSLVTGMTDLSGNGRHATQATPAAQPTLGTASNLLNRPAIVCNNTGLILPAYSLPAPCTVFIAGEVTTIPGVYGWFLCANVVVGCQGGKFGSYNQYFGTMPALSGTNIPSTVIYYVDSYGTAGVRIRFGGVTYTAASGVVGGVGVYSLGYRSDTAAQSMACKVSEAVVFPGEVTGSALTSLSNYSTSLYGQSP